VLNNVHIDGVNDDQAFFGEERDRTHAGYSTSQFASSKWIRVSNRQSSVAARIISQFPILNNRRAVTLATALLFEATPKPLLRHLDR
jgi:hypothetical protein